MGNGQRVQQMTHRTNLKSKEIPAQNVETRKIYRWFL